MDNAGTGTELLCRIGHPIVESRAHTQDQIRMVHGHVGLIGTVHPQPADVLRIGSRITTNTHQGVGNGVTQHPDQLGQLIRRLAKYDPTPGIDNGTLGRHEHIDGFLDLPSVATDGRVVRTKLDLLGEDILVAFVWCRHIFRNINNDRPGTPC